MRPRQELIAGVRGYLLPGCTEQELADAVSKVRRGGRPLGPLVAQRVAESLTCEFPTTRELEVLRLLTQGHGNKAIERSLQ